MDNPIIHWEAIWWIERPTALWIIEIFFALISLVEALLVAYLSYKVTVCTLNSPRYNDDSLRAGQHFAANHFILLHPGIGQHHSLHFHGITSGNSFSFISSCWLIPIGRQMFYLPLRHLFIPVFLNCWLAKRALENMFVSWTWCLTFWSYCIRHIMDGRSKSA